MALLWLVLASHPHTGTIELKGRRSLARVQNKSKLLLVLYPLFHNTEREWEPWWDLRGKLHLRENLVMLLGKSGQHVVGPRWKQINCCPNSVVRRDLLERDTVAEERLFTLFHRSNLFTFVLRSLCGFKDYKGIRRSSSNTAVVISSRLCSINCPNERRIQEKTLLHLANINSVLGYAEEEVTGWAVVTEAEHITTSGREWHVSNFNVILISIWLISLRWTVASGDMPTPEE